MVEPVKHSDMLNKYDVVFCRVEPSGYFYAHLILDFIDKGHHRPHDMGVATHLCFIIGNMKGRVNGSCYANRIYGKLVEVIAPGKGGWTVPDR